MTAAERGLVAYAGVIALESARGAARREALARLDTLEAAIQADWTARLDLDDQLVAIAACVRAVLQGEARTGMVRVEEHNLRLALADYLATRGAAAFEAAAIGGT